MEAVTYQLMRELEDKHWWFVGRRAIIESTLNSMNIPTAAKVLEIGCGTGGNIELLNRYGDVTCVEMEQAAASMARERNLAPVLAGKLPDDLPQFDHSFDLITLFDVIEHVQEDGQSLTNLSSMLNTGGRMLVTVPAFPFLWSKHDDENQHKRRYRRKHLTELAKANGLNVDFISYFNFWLFPPVAGMRLFRKIFPYEESWQDMRMPGDFLNGLLTHVFSSERHILRKTSIPFGISLIAILSVPAKEPITDLSP